MTEHQHQVALFKWARREEKNHPELGIMFAIPNAGKRTPKQGAWMKAEGLRPGVPDIFLPAKRASFSGLFIEMKTEKTSPTDIQWDVITQLMRAGYCVLVCNGFIDAREAIKKYLAL